MNKGFFAFLLVLAAAGQIAADCQLLDVSVLENAAVQKGVQASFPISVTNLGVNNQLITFQGICASDLTCFYSDTPSFTLVPSEAKSFNLLVDTRNADAGLHEINLMTSVSGGSACDSRVLSLNVSEPLIQPPDDSEPFNVALDPTGQFSLRPGEKLEFTVTVTNNRGEKAFVDFRALGDFAQNTQFSLVSVDLAPFETKQVTATVKVPAGTPAENFHPIIRVRGTTNEGLQYYYEMPYDVFVYSEAINLEVRNTPVECVKTWHDNVTNLALEVKNVGENQGPFDISIEGELPVKQLINAPRVLEVIAGDKQALDVLISPKRATLLDEYRFNLVIKYLDYTIKQIPICFTVDAVKGFNVNANDEYTIRRARAEEIEFTVTNNGSIADSYSIELLPPRTMFAQSQPSAFSLSPGESKKVKVIATTSLERTPLGAAVIKAVVRSSNSVSQVQNLNINVVASGENGESFLEVVDIQLQATKGVKTRQLIDVKNNKNAPLHAIAVTLEGVPSEWYSITPVTKDIAAGQKITFVLEVLVPSTASSGEYPVNITVNSLQGEKVVLETMLLATDAGKKLDLGVSDAQYFTAADGSTTIVVTAIVRNPGSTPLSNVRAIATTGYAVLTQPSVVDVQPGSAVAMTISVTTPAGTQAEDLDLRLEAVDGTQSNVIKVKTRAQITQATKSSNWIIYAIAVIVILLAVVIYYTRKKY